VKWILRYLRGSSDMTMCYGGTNVQLLGYVDSVFADDANSWRSTTGYVFTLGSRAVSWISKAVEDSCLVDDEGRVCRSDKSLQGADMA